MGLLFVLLFFLLLSLVFSVFLYFLSFFLSIKLSSSNKLSSFESGFSVVGMSTSMFSIHFFCVLVVFILFEMEVILLVSVLYSVNLVLVFSILLFILGGMYYEFFWGKLCWMV